MLHNLAKAPGSTKARKRVGRGPGSTLGKTCGRGHNGQKSRSGSSIPVGFEGGQMPIHRRLPKRGFTNIFRTQYEILNVGQIAESKRLDLSKKISVEALVEAGLITNKKALVKVLANGDIGQAIEIEAHKFSASAAKKIEDAGGKALVIE